MNNREKLKSMLMDIFLLAESEFRWDLSRDEIANWDSLGVVALAVGIKDVFGYHMTPDEALGLKSINDIIHVLESHDICFEK